MWRNFPQLHGIPFGQVQWKLEGAILLGFQRLVVNEKNEKRIITVVNPSDDTILEKEDDLLVIAECGGTISLTGNYSPSLPKKKLNTVPHFKSAERQHGFNFKILTV